MFDYITADLHLDHPNIIRHCARPFKNVTEMNDYLADTWNTQVGRKDSVAVIGDFAFKRHAHWLHALNGRITLIVGNHDKMSLTTLNNFTKPVGQDRYPGILEYRVDNQPVVLCHYPLYSWRWSSHGAWMLHGHAHGRVRHPEHILALDVGVDLWGFSPVPWHVIAARMRVKAAARDVYQQGVKHPLVNYWNDVVLDQYELNRAAWISTVDNQSGVPRDPRDIRDR